MQDMAHRHFGMMPVVVSLHFVALSFLDATHRPSTFKHFWMHCLILHTGLATVSNQESKKTWLTVFFLCQKVGYAKNAVHVVTIDQANQPTHGTQ